MYASIYLSIYLFMSYYHLSCHCRRTFWSIIILLLLIIIIILLIYFFIIMIMIIIIMIIIITITITIVSIFFSRLYILHSSSFALPVL